MTNFAALFHAPLDFEVLTWFYPALLFSIPVMITEYFGYKGKCEFVDFYESWSFGRKVGLYVVMFYVACFFGKREAYDFIYFAF